MNSRPSPNTSHSVNKLNTVSIGNSMNFIYNNYTQQQQNPYPGTSVQGYSQNQQHFNTNQTIEYSSHFTNEDSEPETFVLNSNHNQELQNHPIDAASHLTNAESILSNDELRTNKHYDDQQNHTIDEASHITNADSIFPNDETINDESKINNHCHEQQNNINEEASNILKQQLKMSNDILKKIKHYDSETIIIKNQLKKNKMILENKNTKNNLRIATMNIDGIDNKKEILIQYYLFKNDIDLLFLQEISIDYKYHITLDN